MARASRFVTLGGVCAALSALAAGGCMRSVSSEAARQEFSSKERSMSSAAPATGARGASSARASARPASIDPALRGNAADILRGASRSEWPALRAHALECAAHDASLLRELAPRGLADENRGVRFVACMAVAEARAADLGDLVQPLLADDSGSVRAAAMLALARAGRKVDLSPLATLVQANDPEVRANTYLVLGELGNPSAVPLIVESLGRGFSLVNPIRARLVDLAAAEALVKLGQETEIEPIRAALFTPPEEAELSIVACDALGRLRDERSRDMLERIVTVDGPAKRAPELRLAAAKALIQIGSRSERPLAVAREYAADPDPRIRAQVASVLGALRTAEAAGLLATLVVDADPTVKVSAAGGMAAIQASAASAEGG